MEFLAQALQKKISNEEKEDQGQNLYLNRISQIFDVAVDQNKPHFIFVKSTLLIIILCLVVYFLYDLFHDFKNEMVIAFLSGISFKKLRQNFIGIFDKNKSGQENKQKAKPIVKIIVLIILFLILPWLRRYAKYDYSSQLLDISRVLQSFITSTNIIIRMAQIYLFINIIKQLFGQKIKLYFSYERLTRKKKNQLSIIFAILLVIVMMFLIILVPVILVNQTTRLINFGINKFETTMDCELSRNLTEGNFTKKPCHQIISNNILQNLTKINNQSKIDGCVDHLMKYEYYFSYLENDFDDYIKTYCFLKEKAEQISPNYLQRLSVQETKNIIFTILEQILIFSSLISNSLYSVTIFITIFLVTVQYFDFTHSHLAIVGKKKNKIVNNIAGIISATIFIAVQHLIFGIFIFEIFRFSNINILISILLSIVAFVPMVKPYFIMLMISIATYWIRGNLISCIICFLYYYWMSGRVYEKSYSNVNMNKVFINLSVIFGIYKYGISGIFYGPLLILLFECVYQELFPKNQ